MRFLHVVSRWQLGATTVNLDPLDPYFGEPAGYSVVAPTRGELTLHPSRVIRFLGNPLPDPLSFGVQLRSDSVLQTLDDAVHAVALTATGATSLIHEAKVDIVTVPNLSEHLANAATTGRRPLPPSPPNADQPEQHPSIREAAFALAPSQRSRCLFAMQRRRRPMT